VVQIKALTDLSRHRANFCKGTSRNIPGGIAEARPGIGSHEQGLPASAKVTRVGQDILTID